MILIFRDKLMNHIRVKHPDKPKPVSPGKSKTEPTKKTKSPVMNGELVAGTESLLRLGEY